MFYNDRIVDLGKEISIFQKTLPSPQPSLPRCFYAYVPHASMKPFSCISCHIGAGVWRVVTKMDNKCPYPSSILPLVTNELWGCVRRLNAVSG